MSKRLTRPQPKVEPKKLKLDDGERAKLLLERDRDFAELEWFAANPSPEFAKAKEEANAAMMKKETEKWKGCESESAAAVGLPEKIPPITKDMIRGVIKTTQVKDDFRSGAILNINGIDKSDFSPHSIEVLAKIANSISITTIIKCQLGPFGNPQINDIEELIKKLAGCSTKDPTMEPSLLDNLATFIELINYTSAHAKVNSELCEMLLVCNVIDYLGETISIGKYLQLLIDNHFMILKPSEERVQVNVALAKLLEVICTNYGIFRDIERVDANLILLLKSVLRYSSSDARILLPLLNAYLCISKYPRRQELLKKLCDTSHLTDIFKSFNQYILVLAETDCHIQELFNFVIQTFPPSQDVPALQIELLYEITSKMNALVSILLTYSMEAQTIMKTSKEVTCLCSYFLLTAYYLINEKAFEYCDAENGKYQPLVFARAKSILIQAVAIFKTCNKTSIFKKVPTAKASLESICFQINSIYDKLNTKELQNVREKGIAIDDRFETVFSKSFRILRKILDEHKSCDQDVIEISSDEDSPSIELIKPPMNEKSNEEIKQELLAASKDSMLEDINAMFSK